MKLSKFDHNREQSTVKPVCIEFTIYSIKEELILV